MKLNLILLTAIFTSGVLHAGELFGQDVVIHLKAATLEKVFDEIEKQTGYAFFYEGNIPSSTFDADFEDVELGKVLIDILKPFRLSYYQRERQIVIIEDNSPPAAQTTSQAGRQQPQEKTVTGSVKDSSGEPLVGAIVLLKGTQTSALTGEGGRFSLNNIPDDGILVFSFFGYETLETPVDSRSELDVILTENIQVLEQVVAVGYGTQKKENLTGSVEVINSRSLVDRPAMNTSQLLQGNVSGVNFSYSSFGAEPGAPLELSIRGQGNPYVIIDGVQGNLNMVNPNDIESMSVLKDAAASAIYGARAPYGVILITTKSGKNNQKLRIDFSANGSFTQAINKPRHVDSYTFVRAMNEMHDNQGVARLYNEETVNRIIAYIDNPSLPETIPNPANPNKWHEYQYANGNNDWIGIHYGTGYRHQENLSVSGGGANNSFFLSAGHSYEKGIFRYGTDNYRRINLNSKLDFDLTKWWKFSSNTRLVQSERKLPNGDAEGGYRTMIHQIIRTQPQDYLKSPNGYYSLRSRIPFMENGIEHTTTKGLVQRFATEITPARNWKINADYAIDFTYADFDNIKPIAYLDNVDGTLYPLPTTMPSSITKQKTHESYQSYNIYTSYELSLRDAHNFKVLAGFQYETFGKNVLEAARKDIITPNVPSLTTSTGEQTNRDELSHWATSGYFGRLNYDYRGKYLFEVNFRYDGTSRFAEGNRWGSFPSFSAGWNVSHEKFWEPLSRYVNSLKIRASWGRLGNQNVNAYQDLPLLTINSQLPWIINDNRPVYITGPNLVNRNLTWETSETTDIGVDLGFFNNRLQATFDIYQRLTFNRLGPARQLPAVLGALVPSENNSELRTRGWDLSISWRDRPTSDFSYSVTAMLFDHSSTVTKYPNETGTLSADYSGKKLSEIWGYTSLGLIQTQEQADHINSSGSQNYISALEWRPGDVMYADLDGDGKVNKGDNTLGNHGDWTVIGNSTPRYQFGLTLTAAWKGFDVSAFFQGTAKRDLWLTGNMFWGFRAWNQSSLFPHHMDYYRDAEGDKYSGLGVNTDAYFPRPYSNTTQDDKNKQSQTRYLQNGAYIRLKNLQIGYTLPKSFLSKIHLTDVRVYVSGENLWTGTSLQPGFDPETADQGYHGHGKLMFTQSVYAIGLNVSF